jgi:hypothetical protein
MNFYEFGQNNTGGSFTVNDKLCHRIFIEAQSPRVANAMLEDLGGYFDGCASGEDCSCCGDRWHPVSEGDAVNFPRAYGNYTKERAEFISEKYSVEARKCTSVKKYDTQGRDWEVVFTSVDQFAQWLADEFGWTSPDVRVYYADGKVLDVYRRK